MIEQNDIKALQAEGKGPAPCARFCEATAFRIEIAGWKRDQAENLANQCGLVDQITALTAERDEWKARCEFSFEQRDKLTAERDALKTSNDSYITLANTAYELTEQRTAERDGLLALHTEQINYTVKIAAERDALKDAARLSLDALDHVQWKNWRTDKAIAALKAVL